MDRRFTTDLQGSATEGGAWTASRQVAGTANASEVVHLFEWLRNQPALYAASADHVRCEDCEIIEFTLELRSGERVVAECGMGFDGDDYWALSKIVDAIIEREVSR